MKMYFVNLVVDFVLLHLFLFIVYTVLFIKTVLRFQHRVVVEKSRWYGQVRNLLKASGSEVRWLSLIILLFFVHIPIAITLLPFGWAIWLHQYYLDAKYRLQEQKRRDELQKAAAKREEDRRQENIRRIEARNQWLANNHLELYYNTVNGITAVLRPVDYELAKVATQRMIRDGFWDKENVLYPFVNTFVFVTKQGAEAIDSNVGGDLRRYKVCGFISKLDDIVLESKVRLILANDIFVPWVNESLIPFNKQRSVIADCVHAGSKYHLVDKQAPAELQPLS